MFGGSAKFCEQNFAEWCNPPEGTGGSACSLRSQRNGGARRNRQEVPLAHCVRSGMEGLAGIGRRFRLLTAFAAEWRGSPEGTGGSACSLRSQRNGGARRNRQGVPLAHCVRSGMVGLAGVGRRFRLLTAFAAEWCNPPEGTGGDGRREESANAGVLPAAHLPFLSPLAAHHSAQRASVARNPLTNSGNQKRASVARNPLTNSGNQKRASVALNPPTNSVGQECASVARNPLTNSGSQKLASVARNPPICGIRFWGFTSGSPHCGFALCGVSTELLYLRDCLGKVFSLKSYVFLPAHLKHQRFLEISGDRNLTKKNAQFKIKLLNLRPLFIH